MDNILNLIGVAITIGSAVYGVYERKIRHKLERSIIGDNWELFNNASRANGNTQAAAKRYVEVHKDNIDAHTLQLLSIADGYGQHVFKTTIRLIQKSEPKINTQVIETWLKSGRISEEYKPLFEIYVDTKDLQENNKN